MKQKRRKADLKIDLGGAHVTKSPMKKSISLVTRIQKKVKSKARPKIIEYFESRLKKI